MTERTLLKQNMDGDTLYLHADTLWSYEDTLIEKRILFAYHQVQFFKADMQHSLRVLAGQKSAAFHPME